MSTKRHGNERKRIVELASALIGEQGLGDFRIDALSERLGYSRQNIYRYYPGKQAILDAVVVEGCRSMAEAIAREMSALDQLTFDERLIEGILLACDLLRGGRKLESYAGVNLSQGVRLFMANAEAVQGVLGEYLQPVFERARKQGVLYGHMSDADLTRWVFQTAVYQLIDAEYQSREARKRFLLAMFSPSINASKARCRVAGEAGQACT